MARRPTTLAPLAPLAPLALLALLALPGCLLETAGMLAVRGDGGGPDASDDAEVERPDGDSDPQDAEAETPPCEDGLLGGLETDLDCGGPDCPPCAEGGSCLADADCETRACVRGRCGPASCRDDETSGDESDVDCGGSCELCDDGRGCRSGADCASRVCAEDATCAPPACDDGVENGAETDLDCGGPCEPCGVDLGCALGRDCTTLLCDAGRCRHPASCLDLLRHDRAVPSGVYDIVPAPGWPPTQVLCDMTADGGGWTLVSSSKDQPPDDRRMDWDRNLTTLQPNDGYEGVWDGLRSSMTETSDIRFTCRADPAPGPDDVDLSFYRVDWYLEVTTGTDAESCFLPDDGRGVFAPSPARRNNLTGELLRRGDRYAYWFLEGEDACDDTDDFSVDFDDRGIDGDQGDGTDWGEDDGQHKCGANNVGNGAWFVWAREGCLECEDGLLSEGETGVDCGGRCAPCRAGSGCVADEECEDGVCSSGLCAAPSCGDAVRNGEETDVDCGGASCPPCGLARWCSGSGDCAAPLECEDGLCAPRAGGACGTASDCPRSFVCRGSACACPRSCAEIHVASPTLPSGLYLLCPEEAGLRRPVRCDMTTDGGGWTLVTSSGGTPPYDRAGEWSEHLATLSPPSGYSYVWDGLRTVVGATHDIRFACSTTVGAPRMTVDLSFYAVDWYLGITVGTDAESCFQEHDGRGADDPPPARRDNLAGVSLPLGDRWNAGYLEGEDDCNARDDFTVDFDDRGMNGNEADGTDWGFDDWVPKCGTERPTAGAWFIWVR